jgi:hypothetical protein
MAELLRVVEEGRAIQCRGHEGGAAATEFQPRWRGIELFAQLHRTTGETTQFADRAFEA